MTGTNIPEGHLRAFEALTRGDYDKLRDQAGIVADVRLHDLRHSYASRAIMNGESPHVTGRLLGHRRPSTTNRCAHLDDANLSQAAELVALAVTTN